MQGQTLERGRHRSVTHSAGARSTVRCRLSGRRRGLRGAFTLIEVLVVVVIIAVLATLVAPSVFQHVGEAKETTARAQVEMLGAALDAYRLHLGRYPTTEEGLSALWQRPPSMPAGWRGPYLSRAVPLDPWGRAYIYRSPGSLERGGYELLSLGADGRSGGDGEARDVTSW